jgi:hypothetical protein
MSFGVGFTEYFSLAICVDNECVYREKLSIDPQEQDYGGLLDEVDWLRRPRPRQRAPDPPPHPGERGR